MYLNGKRVKKATHDVHANEIISQLPKNLVALLSKGQCKKKKKKKPGKLSSNYETDVLTVFYFILLFSHPDILLEVRSLELAWIPSDRNTILIQ